jgi:arabinofuranan 3-O-arabinosyltransferase
LFLVAFRNQFGLVVFNTRADRMLDPVRMAARSFSLWNPIRDMGSLEYQTIGFLFNFDLVFAVTNALLVPVWISERFYMGVVMAIALWGFVRLVDALGIGSKTFRIIGGLAYAVTPMILGRVGWRITETFGAVMLPWILVPLIRAAKGGSTRRAAMTSGIALALVGGMNASVTLAILPAPLLFILTRQKGPRRRSLLLWWLLSVVFATFWWMAGLYLYGAYTSNDLRFTETVAATTLPTSLFNILRGSADWLIAINGADGVLASNTLARRIVPITAIALVTALGLAGLARRRLPERGFLVATFAVGVVAIGGAYTGVLSNPLAASYADLLSGPLNAFRNVYKFQALVTLPLMIGFTAILTWIASRFESVIPRGKLLVMVASVVVVLATAFPALKGELSRPGFSSVPSEWQQVRDFLESDEPTRALILPGMQNASWTWGNTQQTPLDWGSEIASAFRWQGPQGGPTNLVFLDAVEEQVGRGGGTNLAEFLRRAGFSHVVVANDVSPKESLVPDPDAISAALEASGLSVVAEFGDAGFGFSDRRALEVWRIPGASVATMYDASSTAWLSGDVASTLWIPNASFGDRAYVLARDSVPDSLAPASWLITDGNQRSIIDFGRNRNNQTFIFSADDASYKGKNIDRQRYVIDGVDHQTTAELDGIRSVTASSVGPGPLVQNVPGMQPSNVLDGELSTSWVPSRRQIFSATPWGATDPWIEIEYSEPRDVETASISLMLGALRSDLPVRVRTVTDSGAVESDLAPIEEPQPLAVVPGLTTRVRVEVSIDSLNDGGDVIGIRALDFGTGAHPTWLRVPSELVDQFVDPSTNAPGWVFERLRPALNPMVSLSWESEIRRIFTAPRALDESIVAYGRPWDPKWVLSVIDSTPSLTISATQTLGDQPSLAPRNLIDGSGSTRWIATSGVEPLSPPMITMNWSGRRTIDEIRLGSAEGAAWPTSVDIATDGSIQTIAVPSDGIIRFDPISTDAVGITLHFDLPDGSLQPGSVSLSSIDIPAIADLYPGPVDLMTRFEVECGDGPSVIVGDQVIEFAASTTLGELMGRGRIPLRTCGSSMVRLSAGENRLMAETGDSFLKVDGLVLSMPPLGSTNVGTPRSLLIDRWHNDDRTITIGEGAQGLLVVNEIFNRGWVAMLDGNRLESTQIDGWRQAFVVPAGSGGTVRLTFEPNRPYQILTGLGFLLLALMVVLAFIGRRSKDSSDPVGPRLFPDWALLLFVTGVAFWVVGLAALAVPLVWLLRRWRNWSTPAIAAIGVLVAAATVANSPNRLGLRTGWSSLELWVTSAGAAVAFLCVLVNLLPDRRGGDDLQSDNGSEGDD